MNHKETLVVVADASGARFYKTHNRGASIEEAAPNLSAPPNARSGEQMTDRLGRTFSRMGTRRAAIEPKSDPHQRAEDEFARSVGRRLDEIAGPYHNVLIFAPPAFLGSLRKAIGHAVGTKLAGEVHKDLTKSSLEDLRAQVREALFPD